MMNHTHNEQQSNITAAAIDATLHCIAGCAVGETVGLIIGTMVGFDNITTTLLAIVLAFVFGLGLSTLSIVKSGIGVAAALQVAVAADTLSIVTMEAVDNAVMYAIPGAMHATLGDPLFWISMPISLVLAFFAALPVNKYLLKMNKGHALIMNVHHGHKYHH